MATPTPRNTRAVRTAARRLHAALEAAGATVRADHSALVIEAPCALLARQARREIYAARQALFEFVAPTGSALTGDGFSRGPQLQQFPASGRARSTCFRNLQVLYAPPPGFEADDEDEVDDEWAAPLPPEFGP
ncbi:MAG TPA: hypothetical protein VNF92_00170 [Gemmatimonadaceae bacterium]|nr:hypothetical protein [Gemmatimonadaceae bacterium]